MPGDGDLPGRRCARSHAEIRADQSRRLQEPDTTGTSNPLIPGARNGRRVARGMLGAFAELPDITRSEQAWCACASADDGDIEKLGQRGVDDRRLLERREVTGAANDHEPTVRDA